MPVLRYDAAQTLTPLKESVYQGIKRKIIMQDLKPCERINERELMEEYQIGKTPLREVLLRLQHDGLIRRFPRTGTIVSPIDFKELRDAAEIRLELEVLVGRLAVKRVTAQALLQMQNFLHKLEEALLKGVLSDDFIVAETSLHTLLYKLTDNNKLISIITEQQSFFARLWFSAERSGLDLRGQVDDWIQLVDALNNQDEERAIQVNRDHFFTFYNHLRIHF
jgi:DNA-binding GntR family transcriptional regulator